MSRLAIACRRFCILLSIDQIKRRSAITTRVAIVHDWLITAGGAERVLADISRLFPGADLFCLFGQESLAREIAPQIGRFQTSWLNRLGLVHRRHDWFLPLMPFAIQSLNLKGYDLIISSSWAFAHGIQRPSGARHMAYVHSPMRWAWDMQAEYLARHRFPWPAWLWRLLARIFLGGLRHWDRSRGQQLDVIVANSAFVARRIQAAWGRQAHVIYPPVRPLADEDASSAARQTKQLAHPEEPGHGPYCLVLSRLVPYKAVGLWVQAFALLPDLELKIVGDGPERSALEAKKTNNVTFLGWKTDEEIVELIDASSGLLQASKEDFGIAVVEAQARGKPVLAYAEGGASEIVVTNPIDRATGQLFDHRDPERLAGEIRLFLTRSFDPEACRQNAQRFSSQAFAQALMDLSKTLNK